MNEPGDNMALARRAELDRLEARLRETMVGRARNLRVLLHGIGIVLRGQVYSYHGKQLVQHAVMRATDLPIVANEIQVV